MKSRSIIVIFVMLLSAWMIAGCSKANSASEAEATTEIPIVTSDANVVVEGRLVPRESETLSFFTNGQVEEILVEEGDQVKKGDVLARLGNREAIEASIAGAEAELLAAQQALDSLNDNIEVARSEAVKAVASANKAVRDAQYQLDNFIIPVSQQKLTALDAVVTTQKKLNELRLAFEPYKLLSFSDSFRSDLKTKLDNAQSDYNAAVRRLEYETTLAEAEASLEKAIKDYEALQSGPDPDLLAAAQARVKAAETSLASAKAALDNLELVASIDGTVVKQDLIIGQQVVAGQAAIIIADFSQMYAETDDLTEIEVVKVSVGQNVTVGPDALSDVELDGTVDKISDVFEEKRGDITYTARILLNEIDPRLRWGMTVVITFNN
ncbi:MAG: HlyD family efflux transporter periplasmic adaptor subunit [Chloroflexi bacterium]|nr:HlyD family efflux transporter periplasmic adaptor subunit [Chloroflexota bacterium]